MNKQGIISKVMSRRKRSFNDKMLAVVFVPLISLWLLFACYIIWSGVNDETGMVQSNLDFYVSLIAIIGGPALLGINSILEAWKSETTAELATLPDRLTGNMGQGDASHKHALAVEKMKIEHNLALETAKQAHELRMEAYTITGCTEHDEDE